MFRRYIFHAINTRDAVRELFKKSIFYRITIVVSIIFLFLTFLLPIWRLAPESGQIQFIPLHYNVYFGIDKFGPWYEIFYLPILGAALLALNIIFEIMFIKKEHVLSIFFAVATLIVEIMIFIAMVLIILLNL